MKIQRILQIANMNSDSGVACFLMNYYRHIDRSKVQFDFIMDKVDKKNFISEIQSLGGKVYILPHYKKNPMVYYKHIKNILKTSHYKMLHAHEAVVSLFALRAAYHCGVPVRIAHSHNNKMESKSKDMIVYLSHPFFRFYCTDLCACSWSAAGYLFGKKASMSKHIQVIPNAIVAENFRFSPAMRAKYRKKFGLENNFVVGHVGRFNHQKNHAFLIDIFESIHKLRPDAHLMLVGNGETVPEIKRQVQSKGFSNFVSFLGIRADVSQLMQAMDAFVFPSLFEGLGIVLIEAQAAGLPCFTSAKVVPPEVKVTPNLAYLDLKMAPQQWAKQILDKCESYSRKDTLEFIQKSGYDVKKQAAKLQDFYLEKSL